MVGLGILLYFGFRFIIAGDKVNTDGHGMAIVMAMDREKSYILRFVNVIVDRVRANGKIEHVLKKKKKNQIENSRMLVRLD